MAFFETKFKHKKNFFDSEKAESKKFLIKDN